MKLAPALALVALGCASPPVGDIVLPFRITDVIGRDATIVVALDRASIVTDRSACRPPPG